LNRPVGRPQLWWTRLFLADTALEVERTMLAAAPRPSREGSAGLLVNRCNRAAHGEGGSVSLMGATRQASASISASCLADAPDNPLLDVRSEISAAAARSDRRGPK
jgi:hypothetical protein